MLTDQQPQTTRQEVKAVKKSVRVKWLLCLIVSSDTKLKAAEEIIPSKGRRRIDSSCSKIIPKESKVTSQILSRIIPPDRMIKNKSLSVRAK